MFVCFSKPVTSVKKAVDLIQFLAEECLSATKSSQLTFFGKLALFASFICFSDF